MAQDLQTVRARVGVHFDKGGSIRNQALFAAMCLGLAYAHDGRVTRIDVEVDGDDITVTDNGPGISLGTNPATGAPIAQDMMTVIGACNEFKPTADVSSILCGISLAEVNAISSSASIVTMIDDVAYAQKYTLGTPTGPFKKVDRSSQGTRVRFTLDKRWAGRAADTDLVALEAQVRGLELRVDGAELNFTQK